MIIFGVSAIILGGIFCIYGNNMNNNLEAQLESIFTNGVSNPGATYITIGFILIAVGIVLALVGAIVKLNKNTAGEMKEGLAFNKQRIICENCGGQIEKDSKFCIHCGEKINEKQIKQLESICINCGKQLAENSKFCMYCGAENLTEKV